MNSRTRRTEAVDLTPEELGTLKEALGEVLPGILHDMIGRGLIDRDRLSDRAYLWSVVKKDLAELMGNVGVVFELDQEFLDAAKTAMDRRRPAAAVVLLATVIEHKLNTFHRLVLESKGLSYEEVTEIISRNSVPDKLGWLMTLTGSGALPEPMTTRINTLIELRDRIVHYKARPSSTLDAEDTSWHGMHGIKDLLKRLETRSYLALVEEMDQLLETRLEEQDPVWKLAKEMSVAMLSPQPSESAGQA